LEDFQPDSDYEASEEDEEFLKARAKDREYDDLLEGNEFYSNL